MSTAEPFMPADVPREAPASTDRDIDSDVDIVEDHEVSDPDADAAAEKEWESEPAPSFRTPHAGTRLTEEELERDLGTNDAD